MQAGHGSLPDNVGVEWLNAPAAWGFYVSLVVFVRAVIGLTPGIQGFQAWTIANVLHAVITFFLFHWIKGNPFRSYWAYTPATADFQTFWEQIDRRWQNTPSRKFCTAVVVVLYLVTFMSTPPRLINYHIINASVSIVVFIAKLPAMDDVRILGINR
jgi:hypothetical protein